MKHSIGFSSRFSFVLIIAAVLALTLCCDSPEQEEAPVPQAAPADAQPEPLMASGWKLISITGAGFDLTPSGEVEITLVFTPDGQVAGSSGCNRYFSAVELGETGEMSLGPIGSTMMACPEEIMAQEQLFLQALEGAGRYRLAGDRLELLFGEDGVLTFEATEIPEP
jgi:heat shock protein HslJ